MFRWVLITILVLGVSSAVTSVESYDEYAESPTVEIEGCGIYPAIRVFIDNRETENRGFIRNGRVYLAARETLERLGGIVIWVQSQKAFYAQYPKQTRTIRVAVGSPAVRIYQHDQKAQEGAGKLLKTITLNAAPFICGGRVYAPMRAAVEGVGGSVQYDQKANIVRVYQPKSAGA